MTAPTLVCSTLGITSDYIVVNGQKTDTAATEYSRKGEEDFLNRLTQLILDSLSTPSTFL